MAQAVRERREELGVLKAVGFTNAQVLLLVLAESLFLSGVGGAAGLALASDPYRQGQPNPRHAAALLPAGGRSGRGRVLFAALGLITGLMPAWQAMRLNVAEALRRT